MTRLDRTDPGHRFCETCGATIVQSASTCAPCQVDHVPLAQEPVPEHGLLLPHWNLAPARARRRRNAILRSGVFLAATVVATGASFVIVSFLVGSLG